MSNLNTDAIDDFLEFGLCCPDQTFFSSGHPQLYAPMDFLQESAATEDLDFIAAELYEALCRAIAEIVSEKRVEAFAMSGGVDSRLIFSILRRRHPEFLKATYVYTRIHPNLSEHEDSDYLIAEALCAKYGIALNAEVSRGMATTYLKPLNDGTRKVLSGLWGGELLGGMIRNHYFLSSQTVFADSANFSSLAKLVRSLVPSPEKFEHLCFGLHSWLLLESKHTAFYETITWFNPRLADKYTESPFLNKHFLMTMFKYSSTVFNDYRIYKRILERYSAAELEVPLNNRDIPEDFPIRWAREGRQPKLQEAYLEKKYDTPEHLIELERYIDMHTSKKYQPYLKSILPYLSKELLKA